MNNIAHKAIVLKLNRNFIPVGIGLVSKTICDLITGVVKSLDIVYKKTSDGNMDFETYDYINPVGWGEWCKLPVREWDLSIHSSKITIRVPTVVVTSNYYKIHNKKFRGKPTKEGLFIRDNGIDGYTGKEIPDEEGTIDHSIPISRGGDDTYDNTLITTKELNNKKGNRLNSEIGLIPVINPHCPNPIPIFYTIKKARVHDWKHFIIRKKD